LKDLGPHQIYNHVAGIAELGQKSNLYINMKKYYFDEGKNIDNFIP
jgi:hypothetical protein